MVANYERPVGNGLMLGLTGNVQYKSRTHLSADIPSITYPSYATIDASIRLGTQDGRWQLVLRPTNNAASVTAGAFRARRGRADVGDLLQAAATQHGALPLSPAGRAHKRPSALLSALDVSRIRQRASAAHLGACGHADAALSVGRSTSIHRQEPGGQADDSGGRGCAFDRRKCRDAGRVSGRSVGRDDSASAV